MLQYNLDRIFKLRGISNPSLFLRSNGFKGHTALRLINKQFANLSLAQMEKLCIVLNCTPNDLITWTPDQNTPQADSLALKQLIPANIDINLAKIQQEMPLDKMEEFVQKVDELKKSLNN